MAIDVDTLLGWEFPALDHVYTERDAILYALGIGLGRDPTDENELRFLYEDGLEVFPTMALVLGHPGPWYRDPRTGIDWVRVVQGEQEMRLHSRLRPHDRVTSRIKVTDVVDRGPGRGALVYWSRYLSRAETGEPIGTLSSVLVCRNDGGFGGPPPSSRPRPRFTVPETPPPLSCDLPISPRAGLIYRLSGDLNPIHVDPKAARVAGFDRPILHGLCTLGIAAHAVVKTCLDYRAERLVGLRGRFSAPVFPGETLRTELWPDGETIAFRCISVDRGVVVIDGGCATVGELPASTGSDA